jgi:GT2 family glycosyltransferase
MVRVAEKIGRPVPPQNFVAITVTYGSRAASCLECVSHAISAGLQSMIVVVNGVDLEVLSELQSGLLKLECDVIMIICKDNYGPAAGYGIGLEQAMKGTWNRFWLLDDDNLADAESLTELRDFLAGLPDSERNQAQALSLRPDEKWLTRSVSAGSDASPKPGSFMYFDLRSIGARRRRKRDASLEPIRMSTAPYGGLLLSRLAIESVGFPSVEYGLYEDDSEFTARLTAAGFPITLVPSSVVRDVGQKWVGEVVERRLAMLDSEEYFRLWISFRNRCHFDLDRARQSRNQTWFVLNLGGFLLTATAVAASRRKWRQLRVFWSATFRGMTGAPDYGFPVWLEANDLNLKPWAHDGYDIVRLKNG